MSHIDRRTLLTPLRISVVLHAGLLALLIYLVPQPSPEGPAQPLSFRFVADVEPDLEPTEVAATEPAADPVDTLELPDFDVLLPPVQIEDELPQLEEHTTAREPAMTLLRIPSGAARKPAPPAAVKPAAKPSAPRKPRRSVPRVIRRPGTLRGFYPRDARARGIEGEAFVLVHVDADGQVVRARVRKSTGHASLDAAALRVARLYEFMPGRPGRALLPVPFRLGEK